MRGRRQLARPRREVAAILPSLYCPLAGKGSDTSEQAQRSRVIVAKVSLDGHDSGRQDRGPCAPRRGHGMVYTGLHRRPEVVVSAAVDEDVDVTVVTNRRVV